MTHIEQERPSVLGRIKFFFKANLLAGVLTLTPLVATLFFLHILVSFVDRILLLLPKGYRPDALLPFHIPGLGFVLAFIVLLLSGMLVRNLLGRRLVALGEKFVSYIPIVSKIYSAVKQLVETITAGSSREFKRVVLLQYPKYGTYALGYVTGVATGELQRKTNKKVLNIFLPTTPNPTSGFYLIVPEDEVIELDMTVEDSFKLLMSGGIINPEEKSLTRRVLE
jgi:uncharacterized membrane protein